MKIERLENIGVDVKNLDEAARLFSDLLGIQLVNTDWLVKDRGWKKTVTEHGDRTYEETDIKLAMDRTGVLELIESDPPVEKEGLRSIQFKVSNLEEAKAEMKQKGIRLVGELEVGGLKEALYSCEDLCGIRLALIEYDAPTFVDAIMQE